MKFVNYDDGWFCNLEKQPQVYARYDHCSIPPSLHIHMDDTCLHVMICVPFHNPYPQQQPLKRIYALQFCGKMYHFVSLWCSARW